MIESAKSAKSENRRRIGHGFGTGKPVAQIGEAKAFGASALSFLQVAFDLGGEEEVTRPYEQNSWVHAALKVRADAVASVRLKFWQSDKDDAEEVPESDPIVKLFNKPNPLMSRGLLMAAHEIHLRLDGECFWFLTDSMGFPLKPTSAGKIEVPAHVWPIRGVIVEAIWAEQRVGTNGSATTRKVQTGWRYQTEHSHKSHDFPMESVVHFRDYDPNDMRRGLGDVDVLARSINLQFQSERYMEGVVRNSGDPGGFIKVPGKLGGIEKDRVEQAFNDEFSNPANRGQWKVLDEGAEYVPNNVRPKDMEFGALQEFERDRVLAVLGVPGPLVGVWDNSSYNNLVEAQKMLWTGGNGVISSLRATEDALDAFFFPSLRDARQSKYVARFDLSSIEALREDNSQKIKDAEEAVQRGIGVSLNEALAIRGVEVDSYAFEQGDVHMRSPMLTAAMSPEAEAALAAALAEQGAAAGDASDDALANPQGSADPAAAPAPTGDAASAGSIEGAGGLSLNGAQIQAVKDIVVDVATGVLPRDAGKGMLTTLFGLSDQQAETMLGSAGKGTKTTPNKPEGGEPSPAPGDPNAPDAPPTAEDEDDEPAPPEPEADDAKSYEDLRVLRSSDAQAWRREYWRSVDRKVLAPGEKGIQVAAGKFLRNYVEAQLKRLRAVASGKHHLKGWSPLFAKDFSPSEALTIVNALLLDQDEWAGKMAKTVGPKLTNVYVNALKEAAADMGGLQIGVSDPRVMQMLAAQEIKLTEGVTSTLSNRVREALFETLSNVEGANMGSVQQAVADVLPELEGSLRESFTDIDSRALAIARTETGQAANGARFEHMVRNEIEQHEWISSNDDVVRDTHRAADEQGPVAIGQPFVNGLRYPNDPGAPASEVVNCRCVAAAVIHIPGSES